MSYKLLICAQKIDANDHALGFFHSWVEELAKSVEKIVVICNEKGIHNLPENVQVFSLGKESGASKIKKLSKFYFLLFTLRKQYDAVFVHMIEEYVLLGGLIWKFLGKPIFLWRNHYAGSVFTKLAGLFSKKVFFTSKFSYTASFKNSLKMPVGIDKNFAHEEEQINRAPNSVLFLARLDSSKRPEVLIKALGLVKNSGIDFSASFVGKPSNANSTYIDDLRNLAKNLGVSEKISFPGPIPNNQTFRCYRSHEIFVNCSRSGMFDKTLLEASICGCLVLASSKDFEDLAGSEFYFPENDFESLSQKLIRFLTLEEQDKINLRTRLRSAAEGHDLSLLAKRLVQTMQTK